MNLLFDIGYNAGEFSKQVLRRHPECKIIGIEANPFVYVNIHKNITLIKAVASNENNKEIDFYIEGPQSGISTASKRFIKESRFAKGSKNIKDSYSWDKIIKTKTITIDFLIEQYGIPDFIKIDVEGYERNVLHGMTKKSGIISFEWAEELLDELELSIEYLLSIGYTKFGTIGYFDNKRQVRKCVHSHRMNAFIDVPKLYTHNEIIEELKEVCNKDRRINYGMMFCL